ncbi:hypothetical protein ACEQPO_26260 [Bacillus sp. SL00103]
MSRLNKTGDVSQKTSDDPVAKEVKSLQYSTAMFRNEQYQNNLNEAQNWIDTSETSVTEIIDIMSNIRDKVLDQQRNKAARRFRKTSSGNWSDEETNH